MKKSYKTVEGRQSFVAKSGKELEKRVAEYLGLELGKHGIQIIHGDEIKKTEQNTHGFTNIFLFQPKNPIRSRYGEI